MAFTPGQGLKITPSNSPYYRPSGTRSPLKTARGTSDSCLSLRQVIGTTVTSPNGFDCSSERRSFAHTAGAAAVVTVLDQDNNAFQKFYRARPTATPAAVNAMFANPSTSSSSLDLRSRVASSLRESGIGVPLSATASPAGDYNDSPSSKTWTARERIKAATCVSFSPDGRYIAVGETGYNPRVLIFSTATDAPSDSPLTILTEHAFGVKSVAFSPDGRYVASLGTMNDGFIHIWALNSRIGSARLHSSNKCTSNVKHMTWMGNNLVTVGTRHVKVWRVEEVAPNSPSKSRTTAEISMLQSATATTTVRSLNGRNCLLGPLAECVFTCVAAISRVKAIVCSERGDICLIDDSEGTQRLNKMSQVNFGVHCVTAAPNTQDIWVGGKNGKLCKIVVSQALTPETPPESPTPASSEFRSSTQTNSLHITAMGVIGDHLISIDSNRSIRMMKPPVHDDYFGLNVSDLDLKAHKESVQGVRLLPKTDTNEAGFFTWSSDGTVFFWNLQGQHKGSMYIELEQINFAEEDLPNALKVVRASPGAEFFVTGDRYGVLRIIDGTTKVSTADIKAHGSEITDIAINQRSAATLIASSARDRTVQLFRRKENEWMLIQTMDEHQGSVNCLAFVNDGEKLLSSSSDRSVIVREFVSKETECDLIMAYIATRTITLKATPICIAAQPDQTTSILVSTIDRYIHSYDLKTGKSLNSYKSADPETNDSVVLDALSVTSSDVVLRNGFIAAISTTDKSIRIYNKLGICVDKDFGHTEGITDMTMIESDKYGLYDAEKTLLISTGSDGTIMIWEIASRSSSSELLDSPHLTEETPVKETTAAQKPLRRILSRSELAEFQRPDGSESPGFCTPTGRQSPPRSLRKKPSKYSLAQSPRLGIPSASTFGATASPSPLPSPNNAARRSSIRDRSPSPPSPKRTNGTFSSSSRRPSLDVRSRTKSTGNLNEFGSLGMSTEQASRTLRAYRKKLNGTTAAAEVLRAENIRELEKELSLTLRALGTVSGSGGVKIENGVAAVDGPRRKSRVVSSEDIGDQTTAANSSDQDTQKTSDMINEMVVWSLGGKSRSGSESASEKVI